MAANVLIVDDSATMRRMIKRTIEISGLDVAEVYEASNGIEALARMDQYPIGAVLLDINMPVMSGVQLIERLRDDERLRGIPVIIASTEGSHVRIDHLLQAGARGFIRKPFQPEQIRDALAPLLGLKPEPAQPAAADDSAF
jgi:two-component system, chemotaxis family, chemotaxis protein CheY